MADNNRIIKSSSIYHFSGNYYKVREKERERDRENRDRDRERERERDRDYKDYRDRGKCKKVYFFKYWFSFFLLYIFIKRLNRTFG